MLPESLPRSLVELVDESVHTATARVDAVTAIGTRSLLVIVSSDELGQEVVHGRLLCDGTERDFVGSRLAGWRSPHEALDLLLAIPATAGETLSPSGTLLIESAGNVKALTPNDIGQVAHTVASFVSDHVTPRLEPGTRRAVFAQLLETLAAYDLTDNAAPDLFVLRDLIRDAYAPAEIHPASEFAAQVDAIWRIDARSFYIEGWIHDRQTRLRHLRLLTPEGRTVEILDTLSRYRRPDVAEFLNLPPREEPGFIAFVEIPEGSALESGWILQGVSIDGVGFETELPAVIDDIDAARTVILEDLNLTVSNPERLVGEQIGPAISRLQLRSAQSVEIDWIDQHGVRPVDPEVSIVIPIYRQTEFLEHQLAQFVLDPELRSADIIYVLDSPEDGPALRPYAHHLYDLYRVPFRLACLTANGGFSAVNNLGASVAGGRLLLILNSDVLPKQPGWLSRLVAAYDEDPAIGALAPKLLYEDESIQHAGLYFHRPPGSDAWWNEHFYKGLHGNFAAANTARAVPAVTGACMLVGTDLFKEVGGLSGVYVRGDYEDSDLCLRLRDKGFASWYLPSVELYHLEGQSYPSAEREIASRFNRMLHSTLWRESLLELEDVV